MAETLNVQNFRAANRRSPVVSGYAIGNGGEGAVYTLASGKSFSLSADECAVIGVPRWKGVSPASEGGK